MGEGEGEEGREGESKELLTESGAVAASQTFYSRGKNLAA